MSFCFAKIEKCRSWYWAVLSGCWSKWSPMAELHFNWFWGFLSLQFRLGRTFVGFSLFQIDLGMCWVILFCNLKNVRPKWRQSPQLSYWCTTKLCCAMGTAFLWIESRIMHVWKIAQGSTAEKQFWTLDLTCFSNLSEKLAIRCDLR